MYAGNLKQWRKFNNSLMLRLLCRVSGRPEMKSGERIQAMINDQTKYPVISSNADNATVQLTGIDPYFSYFHNKLKTDFTSSTYKASEQMIKMTVYTDDQGIQSYTDPRLPIWFNEGNDGWKGAISGGTPDERNRSNVGAAQLNYEVFVRDDAPVYFMDYAEVLFILAEMEQRGEITLDQTPQELYEGAVKASLLKWAPWGLFSATPCYITDEDVTDEPQPQVTIFAPTISARLKTNSNSLANKNTSPSSGLVWKHITKCAALAIQCSLSVTVPTSTTTSTLSVSLILTPPWPTTAKTWTQPSLAWVATTL